VVVLAFDLAACGYAPASHAASVTRLAPSLSPSTKPPPCPQPITAIFAVHVKPVSGGIEGDAIHCVSVTGDATINDRLLEPPDQSRQLLAADSRLAVEVDGGNVDGSNQLVILDLASASLRSLGTLSSLGIGDPGPVAAVLSPDGSQLAIGGLHKMLLIELPSGISRTLATIPANPSRWLMPLRWTAAGIIAHTVGYEGMGDFGLLLIDYANGTISMLNQGPNNQLAVSPNGKFFAYTTHVDLGDGPSVRYPWQNAVYLTGQDGTQTQVIAEQNHWFTPLDVSDDGQILFASDSQTDPVIADMGIYLARDGHPTQQLTSSFAGEWGGPAQFLDTSRAFVTHLRGGVGDKETSADLELYHLCADRATGCNVSRTTVITFPGTWPTVIVSIIELPTTPS